MAWHAQNYAQNKAEASFICLAQKEFGGVCLKPCQILFICLAGCAQNRAKHVSYLFDMEIGKILEHAVSNFAQISLIYLARNLARYVRNRAKNSTKRIIYLFGTGFGMECSKPLPKTVPNILG